MNFNFLIKLQKKILCKQHLILKINKKNPLLHQLIIEINFQIQIIINIKMPTMIFTTTAILIAIIINNNNNNINFPVKIISKILKKYIRKALVAVNSL